MIRPRSALARSLLAAVCLAALAPLAQAQSVSPDTEQAPDPLHALPRYPTLHGQDLVFVAHGNLWRVSRNGGPASRLTSDAGEDMLPRYSPDGQWIAFTASYQGNRDVYVIPAAGGPARRLTWHSDIASSAPERWGPDNAVVTWTPDSRSVVFLSRRRAWNSWIMQPYRVPVTGGQPSALPLDRAGFMTFGPDGHTVALTRILRDWRTWKRYNGGLAQSIFTYDLTSHALTQITDWSCTNTQPMWFGRKIYFLSDHDSNRRANIWVYDLDTKQFREVTHFTDFDIDFPSLGDSGLTFQQGGVLWVIDLPSETLHRVDTTVPDDGTRTNPRLADLSKSIRATDMAGQADYAIAPNALRAAFSARGDIVTVPAEHGAMRNLTRSSTADDDHPAFSPDGATIAYTSDETGSQQVMLRPASGGPARALTHFRTGYLYGPLFAPDGLHLAFSDGAHALWLIDARGGDPVRIATDPQMEIHDQAFSPDGQWLAFSMSLPNQQRALYLYEISTGQLSRISAPGNSDSLPAFSADGKYLFFASQRQEHLAVAENETNVALLKSTGLYVTTLSRTTPSPFAPRSDESGPAGSPKPQPAPAAHDRVKIDLYGLADRAVKVPVEDSTIVSVQTAGPGVFYMTQPPSLLDGDFPGEKSALHHYDLTARKDEVLQTGLDNFALTPDGSHAMFAREHKYFIAETKPKTQAHEIDVSKLRSWVTPPQEWAEMFENAWRLERDLFFNPQMNGTDWQQIHDKYAQFLPLLGSREDVNWLLGSIQGEIGNSHTYAGGGDMDDLTPPAPTPLLGCDLAVDEATGRYRIVHVLRGDNTRPDYRAPLAQPGLAVHEGDYLLAINGVALEAPTDPDSLLAGASGPISITVSDRIDGAKRDVLVDPVKSELSLREADWITHNRDEVGRLSHGQIGYIYLSDMEALGLQQFMRQFYAQLDKRAVIIDDRWNGGGFVDEIILERLRRVLIGMGTDREGYGMTLPNQLIAGPKVTLINHYSASDGDMFPYYFRQYGLGKLIGTRTWGGVRGIRGMWNLLDGGYISIPEDSLYDLKSHWIIENHGVDPDIVVEDAPADLLRGEDKQLETAVSTLQAELANQPAALPHPPGWLPAYPPGNPPDTHHD
ncbi:S41 family peptidase [Tanticharoenia sakaeratensis]|uniref:S41 family peptidase n=1 Tax=Tanticharoenia sakaeratensis TaxID=444053 RepID=UPI0006629933|nr:S41 family peptidase [Tanticharoenia sakaeratensis]